MDCIWVNFKNVGPPFFKFTVRQFIHVSKCHLLSWKIILNFFFFVKLNLYYNKREKLLTILILDTYPNYSTILYSYERHTTYNKILT